MAETDNPDARIVGARAARFSDGPESKPVRREHGPGAFGRIGQFLHDVRAAVPMTRAYELQLPGWIVRDQNVRVFATTDFQHHTGTGGNRCEEISRVS